MPLKTDFVEEPSLNLTPMIDIVFLLIIFFMVGTQFTEASRKFDIKLPTANDARPLTSLPDELVVNVGLDGAISVNNKSRSLEELKTDLEAAHENYADQAVVIRAAGRGEYQNVMNILSACNATGISNISLEYKKKSEGQ